MDSDTASGFLACPICGVANSKAAYSSHLDTHSKQALIEMLLQQQEALQHGKPGTSKSQGSIHSGRRSPSKKHSVLVPASKPGSTRRQYNSGNHSHISQHQHNLNIEENSPHFAGLTGLNFHTHEVLHDQSVEQIHPIENVETIQQVHGDNNTVILYQLELQDVDLHRENNQSIPFTTVQIPEDPLRLENETDCSGPNKNANSNVSQRAAKIPSTSKAKNPDPRSAKRWIFANATLTVPVVPDEAPGPRGRKKKGISDEALSSDRSNSNNTHSQGVVDLMTDEEIPPRGEISEYEESSSNTSSFQSANDDSIVQRGGIGPSLGSLFSDVRRLSPIAVDSDSFNSLQSKKRKRKPKSQISPLVSAVKANPDGLICVDCPESTYFRSIFELAQHQAEAHPETYKSFTKQSEESSLSVNTVGSPWIPIDRKPLLAVDRSILKTTFDRKKFRTNYAKKYSCLHCSFVGTQKLTLAAHMKSDHPDVKNSSLLFECRTCGRICKSRPSLVKHMLIHNGKKHECGYCLKRFTSNFKLREHERVHTKIYPFKCSECDKQFRTPSLRTVHMKKVHLGEINLRPKPEYYCKICCRVLRSKKSLFNHMQIHTEQKNQKCPYCADTFQKHRVLVRHIRSNHDPTYAAKESKDCPICFKKLHPNSMRSHMRIHNNEKPYACSMCSLTFRTYSNLTSHSWSHTNVDKPYKCTQCPKSYLFKKVLEAHMMVHKRRTFHFVCNECGVKFTSKANMKRHVQEHYQAKKFKCKICGKSFHRNYYLVEHERIHTGTKLFACSICGKNSSTKSNHRAHVKIHDARESGTLEG